LDVAQIKQAKEEIVSIDKAMIKYLTFPLIRISRILILIKNNKKNKSKKRKFKIFLLKDSHLDPLPIPQIIKISKKDIFINFNKFLR
jgi:hypothetical protein